MRGPRRLPLNGMVNWNVNITTFSNLSQIFRLFQDMSCKQWDFSGASQQVWESLEKWIEIVKAMLIHIHHHSPIDCET